MRKALAFLLLVIGSSVVALATAVPEIDPASGGSALALIAGGLLMLRGRGKKK